MQTTTKTHSIFYKAYRIFLIPFAVGMSLIHSNPLPWYEAIALLALLMAATFALIQMADEWTDSE